MESYTAARDVLNMEQEIQNQPYQLKYLVVPDFIYKDSGLGSIELKIASFIYTYRSDKFYFTNEQMSEMFNASISAISRAINKLSKRGIITVEYIIKAGGGKTRLVTRAHSDWASTPRGTKRQRSFLYNIKDNKLKRDSTTSTFAQKTQKPHKTQSYLTHIPLEDIEMFTGKYSANATQVKAMAEKMLNYCKSKPKRYADYRAALHNWLRKEHGSRVDDMAERGYVPAQRAVN